MRTFHAEKRRDSAGSKSSPDVVRRTRQLKFVRMLSDHCLYEVNHFKRIPNMVRWCSKIWAWIAACYVWTWRPHCPESSAEPPFAKPGNVDMAREARVEEPDSVERFAVYWKAQRQ
jgi:hypothetical protein